MRMLRNRWWVLGAALLLLAACGDDSGKQDDLPFDPSANGAQNPANNQTGVACGAIFCAVGQQCIGNMCVTPCATDAECGGLSCCNSVCFDTQVNRSHCGGCNITCMASEMCQAGACLPAMCAGTPGAPIPGSGGGATSSSDAGSDSDAGGGAGPAAPASGGGQGGGSGERGATGRAVSHA